MRWSFGVEPLPEVKPYESFFYTAQNMRSPLTPPSLRQRGRAP